MDYRTSKPSSCNFSTQTSPTHTLLGGYWREQLRVCQWSYNQAHYQGRAYQIWWRVREITDQGGTIAEFTSDTELSSQQYR